MRRAGRARAVQLRLRTDGRCPMQRVHASLASLGTVSLPAHRNWLLVVSVGGDAQHGARRSFLARLAMAVASNVEYNIAGPADDEDFAQAEYLSEMLMVALPAIKCTLIPIMPDDWSDFVKAKSGFLGCKARAPLVWMSTGAVVGGSHH